MKLQIRLPRSPFRGRYRDHWISLIREQPAAIADVIPWALSQRATHSAIDDGVPWIPFRARRWLSKELQTATRAFEWGSGGSTVFLARRLPEVVSIEHDGAWYAKVSEHLRRHNLTHCQYRLVEPQPTSTPGGGFRSGQRGCEHLDFEEYVRVIESYPDGYFDLVMIDGRARISCLNAAWNKVRVGGHILLDNSNYERYRGLLNAPRDFTRRDIAGVSPYRGDVWTQSTVWQRWQ